MALPLPRHRESGAAELAASHTGLGIPGLAIEGVRAHASAIGTGAVAVFRACRRPPAPPDRSRRQPLQDAQSLSLIICLFKIWLMIINCLLARAAGFLPALGSVV